MLTLYARGTLYLPWEKYFRELMNFDVKVIEMSWKGIEHITGVSICPKQDISAPTHILKNDILAPTRPLNKMLFFHLNINRFVSLQQHVDIPTKKMIPT